MMEKKNNTWVWVAVILAVAIIVGALIISSNKTNQNNLSKTDETPKINLCNEINSPTASVNCEANAISDTAKEVKCYLLVSGDSRVEYDFSEYGQWGELGGSTTAGQKTLLNSNNQDRVEITPWYSSQSHHDTNCYNKKVVVYRNQFTGDWRLIG